MSVAECVTTTPDLSRWLGRVTCGDCLELMAELPANSVDSIITDPPYELGFMGKTWDGSGVSFDPATWAACLRVAKPGAFLLAFGGTRTWHRIAVAIEDAGWEIRDTLCWHYGNGFPKSLDIGKAIDKAAGAEREVVGGKHVTKDYSRNGTNGDMLCTGHAEPTDIAITAPATDLAREWDGWGTALKPSWECVIVAQKELTEEQERRTILANLFDLGGKLWSLLPVSTAGVSSPSSQSASEEGFASARWSAEERTATLDALCALTDTCQWQLAVSTCLNTVSSWLNTLVETCATTSTSTTGTETRPTTDWKTLSCCLSALTPLSMAEAAITAPGSWWNAVPAARYFHAAVATIETTRELSVAANVIEQARTSHQGEGGLGLSVGFEPIIVAMKPCDGTFSANAAKWGVAGINVDGCRVQAGTDYTALKVTQGGADCGVPLAPARAVPRAFEPGAGRWPPNTLLSHSSLPVLKLTGHLPKGIMEAIGRYYNGYSRVQELRSRVVRPAAQPGRGEKVLQPKVQSRCVKEDAHGEEGHDGLPGVRAGVPRLQVVDTERSPEVLQPEVCSQELREEDRGEVGEAGYALDGGTAGEGVAEAGGTGDGQARPGSSAVEGRKAHEWRLRERSDTPIGGCGTSDGLPDAPTARVHSGAPLGGGDGTWETIDDQRACPPLERRQAGQQAGELDGTGTRETLSRTPPELHEDPRSGGGECGTTGGDHPLEVLACDVLTCWADFFEPTGEDLGCGPEGCDASCPVRILGEQSGERPAGAFPGPSSVVHDGPSWDIPMGGKPPALKMADHGTAARFFPQFDAEPGFLYCAKASRAERNRGLDAGGDPVTQYGAKPSDWDSADWGKRNANPHPTVKPLALMAWLCRLTETPTGGVVLDPFAGSGTTGVACVQTGREFIGFELDPHYTDICNARIAHAQAEAAAPCDPP